MRRQTDESPPVQGNRSHDELTLALAREEQLTVRRLLSHEYAGTRREHDGLPAPGAVVEQSEATA